MKKIYRIENRAKKHGMWRNFDGSVNPLLDTVLETLPIKELPMPDDDTYRLDNKKWFSAAPSKELLEYWFKKPDVEMLLANGYEIFELTVTDYRILNEFEVVFTRDAILSQRKIPITELWT